MRAAAAETAGTAETAAAMTEQTAETAAPAQESKDDMPVQKEAADGQNSQPAAEAEELSEEIAPAAAVITVAEGVTAVALLGVIISDARVLLWYRRKVKQVKEMMQHGEGGEE